MARNVYTGSRHRVRSLVHQGLAERHRSCRETIHPVSAPSERRRHPRFPVAWAIRLWVDDEPLLGRAEDASRHGLWVTVAPTTALRLGKVCWIDVMSDELGSFTMAGEVRHVSGRRIGLETIRPVPIPGRTRD